MIQRIADEASASRARPPRCGAARRGRPAGIGLALAGLLAAGAVRAQLLAQGSQLWHQDSSGIADAAESDDSFGFALAAGDFDDDGRDDLAVGVPGETVDAGPRAGAVHVLRSAGSTGLGAAGNAVFHQDLPGVLGTAGPDDRFGRALAVGDFNGDGRDDLAVGVDQDAEGGEGGAVQILHGAPGGLAVAGNQLWTQNSPGVSGDSEFADYFGFAVAAGDFDGDGFDDLAIGVPLEDFEDLIADDVNAGRVVVLYGTEDGLSAAREQEWHQDSSGIDGGAENNDSFGEALATGDLDGDGFDDLVVGVIGENDFKGAVNVIYGSASGLTSAGNKLWEQGADGIEEVGEAGDQFGWPLATGDFNGDGFDDLAVGAVGEDVGPEGAEVVDAGAVQVIYGSGAGLAAAGNQLWHEDVAGVFEVAEVDDWFGWALAAADPNADGFADLAIGVPGPNLAGESGGDVHVLYGTEFGLLIFGTQLWNQDTTGIAGVAEPGDWFGAALARGDFDGRGTHVDLAIGVPLEDLGVADAGVAHVLYGYLFHDGFESGDLGAWSEVVP